MKAVVKVEIESRPCGRQDRPLMHFIGMLRLHSTPSIPIKQVKSELVLNHLNYSISPKLHCTHSILRFPHETFKDSNTTIKGVVSSLDDREDDQHMHDQEQPLPQECQPDFLRAGSTRLGTTVGGILKTSLPFGRFMIFPCAQLILKAVLPLPNLEGVGSVT